MQQLAATMYSYSVCNNSNFLNPLSRLVFHYGSIKSSFYFTYSQVMRAKCVGKQLWFMYMGHGDVFTYLEDLICKFWSIYC